MDDLNLGRAMFGFSYQAVNLIRLIQWDRGDPDNIRKLIDEAAASAKQFCPQLAAGIDQGVRDYNAAIDRGVQLKAERKS